MEALEFDPAVLTWFPKPHFRHLLYMTPVTTPEGVRYNGMDEAVKFVQSYIDRAGPFDGLLGFSQGANLASLLTGEAEREGQTPPWRFVVLLCGSYSIWGEGKFPQPLRTPSLHFIGREDPRWEMTEALVDVFSEKTRQVIREDAGHRPPRDPATVDLLRAFMLRTHNGAPSWSEADLL